MSKWQVVLPMGGIGARFAEAGFQTPKPLILVDGVPMYRKALSSLSGLFQDYDLHIIIRQEHNVRYDLKSRLENEIPNVFVHEIEKNTRGSAETVNTIGPHLTKEAPILVLDCDIFFESEELKSALLQPSFDAIIVTFSSEDPRYSYAVVRENLVTDVAEKQVISDRAIIGAYFFKNTGNFLNWNRILLAFDLDEKRKEYYMSGVLEVALNNDAKIFAVNGEFSSFGTPEELSIYMARGSAGDHISDIE
jgi:UDP-N-acetylglucosamine diphosphorylase / glucose-1-phosphate thymidylyltransferase / UDP-N-acetylgalactosamine diphosphorylase / glucosamine-1-phosphate N-acetyltransferase / galactosamine-1-phosphate N-acetyltransferase